METIKIKNNRVGMITLPPVDKDQKGRPLDVGFGAKSLSPGVNLCNRAYVDALNGNAMVELLFDEGMLEFVRDGEPLVPEGFQATLKNASEKLALRHIRDSADVEQLTRWMQTDDRPEVHVAIADRLKNLEGAGRPKAQARSK